jgi:putative transposase
VLISHRIALDPNHAQAPSFARAAATARFVYDWALSEWQRQYEAWKADNSQPRPSQAALRRQLNAVKSEQFAWMGAVTKNAPQQAIKNLGAALKRFFAGQGRYPTFKKKDIHDSFRADNGPDKTHANAVELKERRLKPPVIGWVKMREAVRFKGDHVGSRSAYGRQMVRQSHCRGRSPPLHSPEPSGGRYRSGHNPAGEPE